MVAQQVTGVFIVHMLSFRPFWLDDDADTLQQYVYYTKYIDVIYICAAIFVFQQQHQKQQMIY